jgi:hypothetical protein
MLFLFYVALFCAKPIFFFLLCQSGIGGPLIDFDGNFVGINFYSLKGNPFLPRNKIAKRLMGLWYVYT